MWFDPHAPDTYRQHFCNLCLIDGEYKKMLETVEYIKQYKATTAVHVETPQRIRVESITATSSVNTTEGK